MRVNSETIKQALDELKHRLSPFEIIIFYLKVEKHLTLKEISDIMCVSHETIRQRLQATYKILKDIIRDLSEQEEQPSDSNDIR